MTHLSGHDRSQLLLLPEVVDDYVGPDNPVRFIDAFVDRLDLAAASFGRVEPKGDWSPGLCARRPAEALYLRLFEPGAVEPSAGGRNPPQYRGYLAGTVNLSGLG
jgi:transposase